MRPALHTTLLHCSIVAGSFPRCRCNWFQNKQRDSSGLRNAGLPVLKDHSSAPAAHRAGETSHCSATCRKLQHVHFNLMVAYLRLSSNDQG